MITGTITDHEKTVLILVKVINLKTREVVHLETAEISKTSTVISLLSSDHKSDLPANNSTYSFPWPPPPPSALALVPNSLIISSSEKPTMAQINALIRSALMKSGYHEIRYHSAPEGFVMTTRMERIDSKGRPKEPRWSNEIGPLRKFTLSSYLNALFLAPQGFYRALALVIISTPFIPSKESLTREKVA